MQIQFHPLLSASLLLGLLGCATAKPQASPDQPKAPKEPHFPAIRMFDLETTARLGREIYRQDQLAWKATDVLLAKVDQKQLKADHAHGWVVDSSGNEPLVRFLREKEDHTLEAAYDIRFPEGSQPALVTPPDRKLSEYQTLRIKALQTSSDKMLRAGYPLCPCQGSYNQVVLDDPAGAGFLVYFLRPKNTEDEIPIGGHYRVSVSADGSTVTQVDKLWASCFTTSKKQGLPSGATITGVIFNHIISKAPHEVHVFLSLQDKIPFYVLIPGVATWSISNGTITEDKK